MDLTRLCSWVSCLLYVLEIKINQNNILCIVLYVVQISLDVATRLTIALASPYEAST